MKKNNGVSIITLTITIVILIILAGVAVYYGTTQNVDKTAEVRSFNEIIEVSEATAQRTFMNKINATKYPYVGTELTNAAPEVVNEVSYGDGWYKLASNHFEELSLENVVGTYIVNYSTGEVVSVNPILYEDEEYYSSTDIKDVVGSANVAISSDMYDDVKGVNKPVLLTGMIPVRYINNKWIITSANDEKWYDYSSENKSWANVMLTDEITVTGLSNEEVRNASLLDLEGLEVTTNGSLFVWIPRFTSNSAGDVVYSHLTTDYTENGYQLSRAFTHGITELTGFWESKFDAELK